MRVRRIADVPARPVESPEVKGVSMRVLLGQADGAPSFTLRLFELAPLGHSPRHRHPHEHEVIIREGSGTLSTPEREWELEPGVVVLVGPDEEHQFRAGSAGLSFFCIVPHAGHG